MGDIQYDLARASYYHDYMQAILIAISEGVNVVSCLAWSILDNLEWNQGYTSKFGMQVSYNLRTSVVFEFNLTLGIVCQFYDTGTLLQGQFLRIRECVPGVPGEIEWN